jgi:hypothetical protein
MFLELKRDTLLPDCTFGILTVNGQSYQTLEPTVRPQKIAGQTAIPAGQYALALRTEGEMNSVYTEMFGSAFHKGMLWLQDIPNFTDVYLHIGNYPKDTEGCILVGTARGKLNDVDAVLNSRAAYVQMYPAVATAIAAGDEVVISVGGP